MLKCKASFINPKPYTPNLEPFEIRLKANKTPLHESLYMSSLSGVKTKAHILYSVILACAAPKMGNSPLRTQKNTPPKGLVVRVLRFGVGDFRVWGLGFKVFRVSQEWLGI